LKSSGCYLFGSLWFRYIFSVLLFKNTEKPFHIQSKMMWVFLHFKCFEEKQNFNVVSELY
jgi:hypothetical protein